MNMLGNCEQIVTIPPTTTNQWPHPHPHQNQIIDDRKVSIGRSSSMDQKPAAAGQEQQQALKCPRCDSSNTKFCYYNNYSLSQPRHFCKACKRYWTRGGTLRNVPVGGGCRRNKRTLIKRPSDTSSSSSLVPTSSTTLNNVSQPHIDNTSSSSVFHGMSSNSYNPCDVNLPFSRLFNYDLHPQVNNNATGLGFSSGFMSSEASESYRNGFTSYGSSFRSSSSTFAASSVLPSMLNSNLLQQKLINHGSTFKDGSISNTFQGLEQMQTGISNGNSEAALKDQIEHVGLYDPSLYWNNTPSLMGLWNDQPNLGPSVTSFI